MANDASPPYENPELLIQSTDRPFIARFLTSDVTLLIGVVLVSAAALLLGALSEGRSLFDGDEEIYLRVARIFENGLSLELLRTYEGEPASPAPLFFIVYSLVGKAFGYTYSVLRGFSYLLTLLAVFTVWFSIRPARSKGDRDFFPWLLILFPYIFCMGFAVMAEPLTLLLTVVGMCLYMTGLDRRSNLYLLLGSIAVTGAMYVRIHAMFAPAALMAVLFLRRDWSPLRWFLAVAPFLTRMPLVYLQGGLTVSRESFDNTKPELGFTPTNIHFFFAWLGYSFFPLLWWCTKRWRVNLVITAALTPVFLLFAPDFLGPEHYGALNTFFTKFGIESSLAPWVILPAWATGCFLSIDLLQRILTLTSIREAYFGSCLLLFMLSLCFSTVAFERYYQLAVPIVVLLGVRRTGRSGGYYAFLITHIGFGMMAFARLMSDMP
jgi:hypothetical protein